MKFISLFSLFLAFEAFAFDSDAWLKRRAEFGKDASRLRETYSNTVSRVSDPAENLCVPVEVFSNGSVKTSIEAKRAQILLDANLVWGQDVVISQLDEKGCETLRIEAANLVFDRVRKRGWSEGRARIVYGKTLFKGVDVYFATDEEYVLSFGSSELDSKDLGGARTNVFAKGESISVVSRRCDMDRKSGIVLFSGNARVDYRPGYTLNADRVFAIFNGTNRLDRLIASGHVAITNGLRVGTCERAVFWHGPSEIVMSGSERGHPARLLDESKNSMSGSTIKFWVRSEQVEIAESELIINKSAGNSSLMRNL